MAIFTLGAAMGFTFGGLSATALSALSMGTSMLYQRVRQKSMQSKMDANMDKQKGFSIAVDGEAFDLPILYGHGKVAGGRTYYEVKSDYQAFTKLLVDAEGGVREPATGDYYTAGETFFKIVTYLPTNGYQPGGHVYVEWDSVIKTANSKDPSTTLRADNSNQDSNYDQYDEDTGAIFGSDGAIYLKGALVSSTSSDVYVSFGGGEGESGALTTRTEAIYRVFKIVPDTDTLSETAYFANGLSEGETVTGEKNEFLFVQQAVSYGGVSSVLDIDVNDKPWDFEDYKFGQRIHFYKNGNVADPMAVANLGVADPEKMTFTNTAYASMVFRLNRDDYNYSGSVPNVAFYLHGRAVKSVIKTGDVYTLSKTKIYSNNPALCLLDYLMDPIFGKKLSVSQLNLKSFYDAAQTCDVVVMTNQDVGGKINGVRPEEDGDTQTPVKTDIKRFVCNITLDSGAPIRDNIEALLETMHNAELVWSGGKYKLQLPHPTSWAEQNALIAMTFDATNIVRKSVSVTWPSMSEKYNQATVRFRDESSDFSEDSVSWPARFSTVHKQYLEEDRGVDSTFELFLPGTTDRYHALAKAEQIVRASRRAVTLDMTVRPSGILLEPGDLIQVTDSMTGYQDPSVTPVDDVFKVEEAKTNEDMTVNVKAVGFRFDDLAWNVDSNIGYSYTYSSFNNKLLPTPANVALLVDDLVSIKGDTKGILSWDDPANTRVNDWVIEAHLIDPPTPASPVSFSAGFTQRELDVFNLYDTVLHRLPDQVGFDFWVGTDFTIAEIENRLQSSPEKIWKTLGTSSTNSFEIQGLNTGAYDFSVRARDGSGSKSNRGVYSNSSWQKSNLITGDVLPVTGLTIDRLTSTTYSADFLDLDVRFNSSERGLAKQRYRVTRSGDTWAATISEVVLPIVALDGGFTQRQLDVYNAYVEVLSRQPDQAGFDFWVASTLTIAEIRSNFQAVVDNLSIVPSLVVSGASATAVFTYTDASGSATASAPLILQLPGVDGSSVKAQYSELGTDTWSDTLTPGTDKYIRIATYDPETEIWTPGAAQKFVPELGTEYTVVDGVPAYLHIAYADSAAGAGFSQSPTGKDYIGTYTDDNVADSSNPALYTWALIKGEDAVTGTIQWVDSDTISKNAAGVYSPSSTAVLFDAIFYEGGVRVAQERFQFTRLGDSWSTVVPDPAGAGDLNTSRVTDNSAVVNGRQARTTITYSFGGKTATLDALVKIILDGEPGYTPVKGTDYDDGADAKAIKLTASSQVFTFDGEGVADPTSQTITFTAAGQNLVSPSYVWSEVGDVFNPSTVFGGTSNSMTVADFGTNNQVTVTVTADGVSDSITVYRAQRGGNGLTFVMSNQSHTFSSDAAGNVSSYVGGETTIDVYEGATKLAWDITPDGGEWEITGYTESNISRGTISISGGTTASFTAPSSMAIGSDTAYIDYEIAGKTTAGDDFTATIRQSFTKSKTGLSAIYVSVSAVDASSITKDAAGVYSSSFLDFDVEFLRDGAPVAADRFRVTRSVDTWSSTVSLPAAGVSTDPGSLSATMTSNGQNGALTVSHSGSGIKTVIPVSIIIEGSNGNTGDSLYTGRVYHQNLTETTPVPSSPSIFSAYNTATGTFGTLSAGWVYDPPEVNGTNTALKMWSSRYTVLVDGVTGAQTITFSAATGAIIFANDIQSDNYDGDGTVSGAKGSDGWFVGRTNGYAEFGAAAIRGKLGVGQLSIDDTVTFDTDGAGNLIIRTNGIKTASLDTGAVSTIKVENDAVSEPFGTNTGTSQNYTSMSGGWATVAQKAMDVTDVQEVKLDWFMEQGYLSGSTGKWKYRIRRGATVIKSRDLFMFLALDQAAGSWIDTTPGTGVVTYYLEWGTDDVSDNHTCIGTINLGGRKK